MDTEESVTFCGFLGLRPIEFQYQDLNTINQEWKTEEGRQIRFSKRRELHWIDADRLLFIYQYQPKKLWKRVRQLVNARAMIETIKQEKLNSRQ